MTNKTYTQKELERILQDDGFDIGDENNIIDPDIVAELAKQQGFIYDEDLDVWRDSNYVYQSKSYYQQTLNEFLNQYDNQKVLAILSTQGISIQFKNIESNTMEVGNSDRRFLRTIPLKVDAVLKNGLKSELIAECETYKQYLMKDSYQLDDNKLVKHIQDQFKDKLASTDDSKIYKILYDVKKTLFLKIDILRILETLM